MDYLQYKAMSISGDITVSFKPYYKWITFNIQKNFNGMEDGRVLNLIINGLPSIFFYFICYNTIDKHSFKPYYKWITFNIIRKLMI